MSWIELLLLSLSLAMDCFAISCVIGMLQPELKRSYVLRFSLAFGIFQGGMPLIGWLFGESRLSDLVRHGDRRLCHSGVHRWKNADREFQERGRRKV